jgi:hypothetical protein
VYGSFSLAGPPCDCCSRLFCQRALRCLSAIYSPFTVFRGAAGRRAQRWSWRNLAIQQ